MLRPPIPFVPACLARGSDGRRGEEGEADLGESPEGGEGEGWPEARKERPASRATSLSGEVRW